MACAKAAALLAATWAILSHRPGGREMKKSIVDFRVRAPDWSRVQNEQNEPLRACQLHLNRGTRNWGWDALLRSRTNGTRRLWQLAATCTLGTASRGCTSVGTTTDRGCRCDPVDGLVFKYIYTGRLQSSAGLPPRRDSDEERQRGEQEEFGAIPNLEKLTEEEKRRDHH